MMRSRRVRRFVGRTALVAGALLSVVIRAPAVLAFPHHQRIGVVDVYAERPIDPRFTGVLARADALVAASPIAGGAMERSLFLTDGGWRWRLIALTSRGTFGLRRPLSSALAFNRSDIATDQIFNRSANGRTRTLSGTIAHETAHLLVARRFGEGRALLLPTWLQEGFADHVAQESTLSDREAAALRARGSDERALVYYDGRRRVAAILAKNGGSIEALFR